jgi:hypothetical protein
MDGPGRDTYFANMVAAGAQSVRMDIKAVDASYIDLVARAKAHGLHVLVLLPNFADLTSLALPAIQQFGATVDYELGNELNIHAVTPAQWQSVNNATYTKMKIVSPAAKVISSGLSPWGQYGQASNGTHWNPLDYLKQALSLGPLLCDAIGWHPYPTDEKYSGNWNDVLTSPYSGWRDMVAAAAFVPGMKFAATEYGVPTLTGYATEAQQAQFIADSFAAWKTYSWADDIHIYSGLDQGTGGTNKENNFGLYRNNYSAKPAVSAFKAASV